MILDSLEPIEPEGQEPSGTRVRDGGDSDHPLVIEEAKEMETMEVETMVSVAVSTTATLMEMTP